MAKAPFWLRGGKGKLAGSVLFKGEKGTIVRENVTPHNPQSGGQMRQRVVWATVTQAAKRMLPIIGLSFEGIGSEKLNRRKFVQLNATILSNMARNIIASGTNTDGLAFSGKGNNQLIPNPYIIARGSLQLPRQEYAPVKSGSDIGDIVFSASVPFGTYSPLQLWQLIYGFKPGSQFTIPYISYNTEKWASQITDSVGAAIDGIRYSNFYAPRLVLKESASGSITVSAETTAETLIAFLLTAVEEEKSDQQLVDTFLTLDVASSTGAIRVDVNILLSDITEVGSYKAGCVGTIYSEKDPDGAWKYTNSRMVSLLTDNFDGEMYFGLDLKNAMDTFRKTNTTDKNYLQTGGEGGNI